MTKAEIQQQAQSFTETSFTMVRPEWMEKQSEEWKGRKEGRKEGEIERRNIVL